MNCFARASISGEAAVPLPVIGSLIDTLVSVLLVIAARMARRGAGLAVRGDAQCVIRDGGGRRAGFLTHHGSRIIRASRITNYRGWIDSK
jgi:hypothetical protein